MSLFGSILSKIFGGGSTTAQASVPHAAEAPTVSPAASGSLGAGAGSSYAAVPAMSGAPSPTADVAPTAGKDVDVGRVLADMAAKKGGSLNYKQSIVDLMKLLDLDSSLTARKQLADELHYTGDKEDSASMNVWLHREVVRKLAENGGKVPADMQRG